MAIARSEQIHDELWSLAEAVAKENAEPITSLYLSALNEVIDLHTERINAELGYRVPATIVLGLYIVAVLTMVLIGVYNSYHEKRNLIAQITVVLIVSVVLLLILDLDRSNVGLLRIPQEVLLSLQHRLTLGP